LKLLNPDTSLNPTVYKEKCQDKAASRIFKIRPLVEGILYIVWWGILFSATLYSGVTKVGDHPVRHCPLKSGSDDLVMFLAFVSSPLSPSPPFIPTSFVNSAARS